METVITKDKMISLWGIIMNLASLDGITVCDVPFWSVENNTNGIICVSNGLLKYHFYLHPNREGTQFMLRLENWASEYEGKRKQLLKSKAVNVLNAREYNFVGEVEISKEEYLQIYNTTKEYKESLLLMLDKELSLYSIDENKIREMEIEKLKELKLKYPHV